jgi:hypothetical protein
MTNNVNLYDKQCRSISVHMANSVDRYDKQCGSTNIKLILDNIKFNILGHLVLCYRTNLDERTVCAESTVNSVDVVMA